MKTSKFSLTRSLLPTALCCLLALPVLGLSNTALAVEKKPSVPAMLEQAIKVVNINQADAETLSQVLRGVGDKKAQAIVSWRQQHGKFTNINQLLDIKGIGEKILNDNRGRIKL